jgi:hypothetical protein
MPRLTRPSATVTPTVTPTPSITPLPPTPTAARPTPLPSGYFVSVYQGQIQAPGLDKGLIRGRVVDFRGAGIASFPITCTTSGVAYSTATGADGSYAIGGLKSGIYSIAITGYPHTPAEGIYLPPGRVISVDFVEAARPGASPAAGPTATTASAGAEEATPRSKPGVVIVVLTPEGGAPAGSARPTATTAPTPEPQAAELPLPSGSWLEAFLIGMAASYGIAVLGLVVAGLRR